MGNNANWVAGVDYPVWMKERSLATLKGGYLMGDETPKDAMMRIARRVDEIIPSKVYNGDLKQAVFDSMWNQEVSPSSPVWSNFGHKRGLPISCLTANSWINTRKEGGKQIKNIKIGDEVLTHKGRWRKVIDLQNRMSSDDLYKLKVSSRTTPIQITGNHPVLTNLGWVRVDELNPSIHYIATNNTLEYEGSKKYIELGDTSNNSASSKVEITSDLAWALGLWFAEGSIILDGKKNPSGIKITMGTNEEETLNRFKSIMENSFNLVGKLLNIEAVRKDDSTQSWSDVRFYSKDLGNYFLNNYGKDCRVKNLDENLKTLEVEHLKELFKGFYKGDGRKTTKTQSFGLANPKLAMSLYEVGLKCGYQMGLRLDGKPGKLSTTDGIHTVYIYCNQGELKDTREVNKRSGIPFNDGNRYCSFTLTKLDHNERVYDLTVEEDHSFSVAGVVVHNCFGSYIGDSISSIYGGLAENAKMSQLGGGTSSYWGDVRARGSAISNQTGSTGGPMEFLSNYDGMITKVSQGGTRRGSHASYMDFSHGDILDFLEIKRVGCEIQNLFTGVVISQDDIEDIYRGDERALKVWSKILESRNHTGMPYLLFKDNANDGKTTPPWYGLKKTQIKASNLCNEIMLPSNEYESFVCCLLSMNLTTYDSWKHKDSVQIANIMLEAILEDFIMKTTGIDEMQKSRRFAQRHRAVGLGALGFHSYLQAKGQPFTGMYSTAITRQMFNHIKTESRKSSKNLAKILGNAPIVEEYNKKYGTNHLARHSTLMAIAPTVSNATIGGGMSAGIEPLPSNYYSQKSAKGNFTVVNQHLEDLIKNKYPVYDNPDTWDSIRLNQGSVQHLSWMEEHDRNVFKTFSEINQFELVRLAAVRQEYIDQGQSLNVFIAPDTKPELISALYLMGAELGIKGFYYQRSSNILRDKGSNRGELSMDPVACDSCDG